MAASSLLRVPLAVWRADDAAGGLACLGCFGFVGFFFIAILVLHIVILVWVARDAKNRGMDNAVLWMVLVMITGLLGLLIYVLARPQGNVVPCQHCSNKRLQVSAKCPHCGNF